MPKDSNPHGGWGGPGRGGGAHPKDPAAALDKAIRTLVHRLAFCRERDIGTYAERRAVFSQIDALHEQAEVYLCEAPDYPEDAESRRRAELQD